MRHRECGLPLSTNETRSLRNARRSTYTVDGSGLDAPCKTVKRSGINFSFKTQYRVLLTHLLISSNKSTLTPRININLLIATLRCVVVP